MYDEKVAATMIKVSIFVVLLLISTYCSLTAYSSTTMFYSGVASGTSVVNLIMIYLGVVD